MKCSKCKKDISENLSICPHCGTANPTENIQNTKLLNDYAQKLQSLMKSVGTAQHTEIAWNMEVSRYVQKMEKLKIILSQPEFSRASGERLIKRIGGFVERCKDPVFHIAFVGTIKAGKSTLINALLGRNLASTSVTPETAVLTKFRSSKTDYVKISFYTSDEWTQLWNSISNNADIFKQEYAALNGDSAKSEWINHKTIKQKVSKDSLESEIERWTSSKHVEHYFVKEVEIGLSDFSMPEQIVFVDTPGLDDAVKYRSDVTREYIDRANAVFACVRSDALTGGELSTLFRIFTNTSDTPEKVFVLGTQWDNLNEPEKDWKIQKKKWVEYLSMPNCYGDTQTAQKNIINVAAYLMNLCREYDGSRDMQKKIQRIAGAFPEFDDKIVMPKDVEEHLEELMEKSNVSEVERCIRQHIIPKYQKFLMNDIIANYQAISREIKQFFEETKESQNEVLQTSMKSADEIRRSYEKSKKELEDVQAYREQLELAMKQLRENTDERVAALCKSLEDMTKTA
ncbi:MAG: dynamin family protein [Oscillospiraceae bacterium]|nr:dynamin family protein [Oscillospiraceae bacterium]